MKRTAGPFEILEILGEGSFGTVCVARVSADPLRRKVALKILKGAYATNEKILNRTRDEARLLSAISHPNIVRVERLMEIGGRPVVVMEHVQGVSLDQLLLRFKEGLPGAIALEVVRQTCLALHVAYAEALGDDGRPLRVIHRDIKPSNVMLSIHGEVKVLDFGIARGEFEGREARTESVVMGSRPYMAPERLDGVNDSQAVDVYSAGMSLFELLTGRTMSLSINPVSHDQAMNRQLQYVHIQGMTAPAVEDLRDLIRRMCAYTRDYRPSAADCARDLEQLQYAMDRRYHIALDEFARTTVLPIYETRTRVTPEDALKDEETDVFRDVTDALSGAVHTPPATPRANWMPYLFVGLLGFVVVLLAVLAVGKWYFTADPLLRVEIWIPKGASAWYGEQFVSTPSEVRVPPGPKLLRIQLDDPAGRTLDCEVDARQSVRWVGEDSVSVDNGQAQRCLPARPGDVGPGLPGEPAAEPGIPTDIEVDARQPDGVVPRRPVTARPGLAEPRAQRADPPDRDEATEAVEPEPADVEPDAIDVIEREVVVEAAELRPQPDPTPTRAVLPTRATSEAARVVPAPEPTAAAAPPTDDGEAEPTDARPTQPLAEGPR